jgi:hypothetical protein
MSNDPTQSAGIPTREANITKLVDASQLLEILWDEESRPSLRWLRDRQAERELPADAKVLHFGECAVETCFQS